MAQIVVLKRAHFFSLDNDIIDVHAKTIGALGLAIYTTLARYANRKTGQCWPSIERLARTLDLARSTVKVYLRKLEEAGLVAIQERRDPAGDPTSNCYTLLDPSPGAVHPRLGSRTAMAAPEPGGGRLPADPPPVACRPTGRPPADPQPNLASSTKEQNHEQDARAADETPKTPSGNPCPHPLEEHSHFGEVVICQHCWSMIDVRTLSGGCVAMERKAGKFILPSPLIGSTESSCSYSISLAAHSPVMRVGKDCVKVPIGILLAR